MSDLQSIRSKMTQRQIDDAEREISDAVAFAEQHLKNRSNTFIGALLGLMVGMLFGGGDVGKFDEWARLIRDDMLRNNNRQRRH